MSGWFAVKHGITEHPIFKGKPLRLAAWIWMLDNTAWADTLQDVDGEIITVKRGELCASQAMIAAGSGMTRQQVRTFLEVLKREKVIHTRPAQNLTKGRTIVTVCNYDKYQTPQPSSNQAATKQQPTKEQDNNIPVGEGAFATSDPVKILFDSGVKILTGSGVRQQQARALLGRWRKDYGVEPVIAAIGACQREGAVEPVAFITKALSSAKQRREGHPEIGDVKEVNGVKKRYAGNGVGWVTEHV